MAQRRITDLLKSRVNDRSASFPAGAYRAQQERQKAEGSDFVRDPNAEQIILQKFETAFLYSKFVLKGPWPEFEAAMDAAPPTSNVGSIRAIYNYAQDVKRGPVPGGEKHLANNGEIAADYAVNILETKWADDNPVHVRAQDAIAANPNAQEVYSQAFESRDSRKSFG